MWDDPFAASFIEPVDCDTYDDYLGTCTTTDYCDHVFYVAGPLDGVVSGIRNVRTLHLEL